MIDSIRPLMFFSIITGLILGILLSLPVIQIFSAVLFFMVGALVCVMLKNKHFVENIDQKDGIIIGCISGFVSVVAASVSFLLFAGILNVIFSGMYAMITAFFTSLSYFIVLVLLVFCIGIINAIFNAGSALLIVSFYNGKNLQKFELKREKNEKSINS